MAFGPGDVKEHAKRTRAWLEKLEATALADVSEKLAEAQEALVAVAEAQAVCRKVDFWLFGPDVWAQVATDGPPALSVDVPLSVVTDLPPGALGTVPGPAAREETCRQYVAAGWSVAEFRQEGRDTVLRLREEG